MQILGPPIRRLAHRKLRQVSGREGPQIDSLSSPSCNRETSNNNDDEKESPIIPTTTHRPFHQLSRSSHKHATAPAPSPPFSPSFFSQTSRPPTLRLSSSTNHLSFLKAYQQSHFHTLPLSILLSKFPPLCPYP